MKLNLTRRRTLAIAAFAVAALLSPIGGVEACSPGFTDDVFVRSTMPDDLAAFAKGQLGILQSGYDSDEYAAAYRYLIGGTLDAREQSAISPQINPGQLTAEQWQAREKTEKENELAAPPNQWLKARGEFLAPSADAQIYDFAQPPRMTDNNGSITFDGEYLNCPDPAFTSATLTLRKRAVAWGQSSPALLNWIQAQDAVFSNCGGKSASMPAPAPAGAPTLLRADRAYQTAAATFYAKKFDEAARQFAAIANDTDSPWRDWGAYLAARATIRKAFAMGKQTDQYSSDLADFDSSTMKQAQQMLESLLAEPHPAPSREAVQSELNFIRIRTEPAKRMAEISAALEGPRPDPHFRQDLADLNWMLVKSSFNKPAGDKANVLQVPVKDLPPLLTWIAAWRGMVKPAATYALWQQTHALPWLVVTIAGANATDPFAHELLSAAAAIPASSPAYPTLFYDRVRLLIAIKQYDEARALLDPALAATNPRKPDSWRNALLSQRMAAARSFVEFLTYAPRTVLETGSQGAMDLQGACDARAKKQYGADCPELKLAPGFDSDATDVFNQQLPLAQLIEAAQSQQLAPNLRQNLAVVAWTRAVMLEDAKSAALIAPLLPKSLNVTAATGTGFPAVLTILRNDGIRPYLEPGIPRVASYNQFDELRENWWCKPWGDYENPETAKHKPPLPVPAFLSTSDLAQATAELNRLHQLPESVNLLGQRVLAYAKTNPADPQLPEALALTVRAGHYACQSYMPYDPNNTNPKGPYTDTSKAAFQLLHKNYPKSPWTAKTPYYY